MALVDWSLPELEAYAPPREEPDDFDAFWSSTLSAARSSGTEPRFVPVDSGLSTLDVWDVTFPGFAGDPIRGWLLAPRGAGGPLPCVVTYIGYGSGRGMPHEWLVYASAGYANLVMDTRGQGGQWVRGDTPDPGPPADPQFPGFLTRGVLAPETYYYRRLITDAVRAVDAARVAPMVDPSRIVVAGGSQGGGLALAVAGLLGREVAAALVDVPFLCHFRRAADVATDGPYPELVGFCRVQRDRVADVFRTLSYVDGMNFAARGGEVPASFSVGLCDPVCPPSTVYAAYHHYAGPKRMAVWPYNGHEGGEAYQQVEHLRFLAETLG